MSGTVGSSERYTEIEQAWRAHRIEVSAAAQSAGRDPDSITTIAVTKKFPRSDVDHLLALGVRDVGENADQEARGKLLDPPLDASVRRHFIGHFQSNKAASILSWADLIHSVDRAKLIRALHKAGQRVERTPSILIQVNADDLGSQAPDVVPEGDAQRSGAAPEQVLELAEEARASGITVRGLMMVAPREGDPAPAFALLQELSTQLQAQIPEATLISAGMSGDFSTAIAHGATHLRVGGAILGNRYARP